ncbi:MAG: hypothetical protein KKH68_05720, partial [Proteobacteria bacterium]|nr:hypothetical protein [Pseudomonadota bacterium]
DISAFIDIGTVIFHEFEDGDHTMQIRSGPGVNPMKNHHSLWRSYKKELTNLILLYFRVFVLS